MDDVLWMTSSVVLFLFSHNYPQTFVKMYLCVVGMVTKPSNEQSQDFSIHNEDFPALPGPNYKDPTLSTDESKSVSTAWIWSFISFIERYK